jgi:hypothetical protein
VKTCFTTKTSDLTGFMFPDRQELDGSDPTDTPTSTPTDDIPEEAQTDIADSLEPTSEAVLTSTDMAAIVTTATISTYSTDWHGMIALSAAMTNSDADMQGLVDPTVMRT